MFLLTLKRANPSVPVNHPNSKMLLQKAVYSIDFRDSPDLPKNGG